MYPSAKASFTNPDDSNEVEEEAVLQGTLYVPVHSTIKDTRSSLQWLKSNNPLYKDAEINSNWLSDAAQDDAEMWEALSAEQCSPPRSSPTVNITTSSQSKNGKHL